MTAFCSACERPVGRPYIVVDEGGSTPRSIVCVECIDAIADRDPDERTRLSDLAVIAEGHACVEYAEVRGLDPIWECSLCNVVLEQSGDALVVPS